MATPDTPHIAGTPGPKKGVLGRPKKRKAPNGATVGDSSLAHIPAAAFSGVLKIGETEIDCFVLDDTRRVLSGRGIARAMKRKGGGGSAMKRLIESKWLKPHMSADLNSTLDTPIMFTISEGVQPAFGYDALILPEICNAILDAADALELSPSQQVTATQAKILSRAFATVGIVSLVDEATGYQEVRDRDALHAILDKYIRWHDLAEWAKTFDDQFYEQLFRLKGWQYTPLVVARPSYVGKLTNDLVYARLAPGVLAALRTIGERDEKGRLKRHHHRRLTDDVGRPALREHLSAVVALMKVSPSWRQFMNRMNRVFPRVDQTLLLAYDMDEEEEYNNE